LGQQDPIGHKGKELIIVFLEIVIDAAGMLEVLNLTFQQFMCLNFVLIISLGHFEGIEIYLNSRSYMFGQSGGPTFEMPAGVHRYEFTCQLPPHIPYTVGLQHAEIGYYVEAVLDIPWKFDKESKIPLTIIPYVDLNFYQHLRIPQNFEMYKNTCSLFCETGRVQMTIHVPYTGFAIGQKVPVKFSYINKSNVDVLRTKMTLKRIITYNAQTPHPKTKIKKENMFFAITDGCKNGETVSFDSIFEIPIVMLCTNDNVCRVASIAYVMKIEAVFGGLRSNLKTVFPVIIGTNPIREEDPFPQNPFPSPALNPYQYSVPMIQPSAPNFRKCKNMSHNN